MGDVGNLMFGFKCACAVLSGVIFAIHINNHITFIWVSETVCNGP